jgi:hypothetical protein
MDYKQEGCTATAAAGMNLIRNAGTSTYIAIATATTDECIIYANIDPAGPKNQNSHYTKKKDNIK